MGGLSIKILNRHNGQFRDLSNHNSRRINWLRGSESIINSWQLVIILSENSNRDFSRSLLTDFSNGGKIRLIIISRLECLLIINLRGIIKGGHWTDTLLWGGLNILSRNNLFWFSSGLRNSVNNLRLGGGLLIWNFYWSVLESYEFHGFFFGRKIFKLIQRLLRIYIKTKKLLFSIILDDLNDYEVLIFLFSIHIVNLTSWLVEGSQ